MSGARRPTTNQIAHPAPPTPATLPAARAMDTYGAPVDEAFAAKEGTFYGPAAHTRDAVITMQSQFGFFRVESYPNQANPNDIHYVVFFHNKTTSETFEVHGTIALFYIALVRNNLAIQDISIADTRICRADTQDSISYFSQYSLRWQRTTNNVIKKFYKPYDPALATDQARLHDYDPAVKNTLVGYSEEYTIASGTLAFANWKDEADLGRYNGSIKVRSVGMPTQILLHETAGFGNLAIASVRQENTSDGGHYFPIPHFCVNNQDSEGKGSIIQFVDVATNVPHGESTNERAVGIEFVNAPIEAFKVDAQGHVIQPLEKVFNLEASERGVYLATKLAGFPKLFIPLEFSADPKGGYYELALLKSKLLNFTTLNAGIGPSKQKVLTVDGPNVLIKYAKSDKFEHLAALVWALTTNGLVKNLPNLTDEAIWKLVVTDASKSYYVFQHGWEKRDEGTHFFGDIRQPAILTHLFIGSHADGGLQGLYLYLKFVKRVPLEAILQLMITFLTSDKTAGERAGVKLKSKVLGKNGVFSDPATPIEKTFQDILELDQDVIGSVAPPP